MAVELKAFRLLAEFGDDDRELLADLLDCKTLGKGRTLFREGGESQELMLVARGTIELSSARCEHKSVIGPGTALGALSLLVVGPREVAAKTLEPCELRILARESFRRLVDDHPQTACRLVEAIAVDLAHDLRSALDSLADG